MFSNYLKVALRNLMRHKGYSAINILGLAVGMAACIVILLWVRFNLSYDDFHANADRVYLLYEKQNFSGNGEFESIATMVAMGPAILDEYPEVESCARFYNANGFNTRVQGSPVKVKTVFMADSSVFNMFSFRFLLGDPRSALVEPYSIVLTEQCAGLLFGTENPLGKVLRSQENDYKVTGVVENVPRNSVLGFDMLISWSTLESGGNSTGSGWGNNCLITYLMLREGADCQALEKKFPSLINKHIPSVGDKIKLYLHPLRDLNQRFGLLAGGPSWTRIYFFTVLALIVLLVAGVNFVNLSLARSTGRAREVGLRKTVGAGRWQLILQFLSESVIFSLCALFLAVVLLELVLPGLNVFFSKKLVFSYLRNWRLCLGSIGIALLVGVLAGVYPALVLSSYNPTKVFKDLAVSGLKGHFLRRCLVIGQFTVSIILIIFTIFAVRELRFLRDSDLGFDQQQVVNLPLSGEMAGRMQGIREELSQSPAITAVTASSNTFGNVFITIGIRYEGMDPNKENWSVSSMFVDKNFIPFYGLKLVAGRNFSNDFSTDAGNAYLINEELARQIGWTPQEAVGKRFAMWNGSEGSVIGVVGDFNFNSLHSGIKPLALKNDPSWLKFASVRIDPENVTGALAFLRKRWGEYVPDQPFEYSFLDEEFARLYQADRQAVLLVGSFSGLAVLIACLGLLGMISIAVERRTKELGVRKVLGASVADILLLLSKEFLLLLGISVLIAWPVAWYVMNKWLANFAYRIELDWLTFLAGGLIALAVAALTVGWQALRAATADPVKAMRYE